MNRKIQIVIAVAALSACTAAYVYHRQADRNGHLVLYGNIDIRELDLAFRQPGRLVSLAFDEGAAVKAGQVMAELDAQPFRTALAVAAAEVRRARAELDKLNRGHRPQEIAQAEEAVRQAEAASRNAEIDLERQTTLVEAGAASQRALDSAQMVHDQARAGLAAARQALALRKAGWRREEIGEAAARLEAAEAAETQARTAVEDTRLIAPSDGVVVSRQREPGSMVSSRDGIFALSLGGPPYVRAYVGERDLGQVAPGTPVVVRTDSSKKAYRGQVGFVSPRAEFTPKSVETADLRTDLVYRLRVVVTDADDRLRQGMPVTVDVEPSRVAN